MPGSKDPSHYTIYRWTGVVSGQRLDWTKVRTQGGIRTKVITRGGIRTKVRTNENSLGGIISNIKKKQYEHPFGGSDQYNYPRGSMIKTYIFTTYSNLCPL